MVSIHAPTRGATGCSQATVSDWVFQSTRPRGARPYPPLSFDCRMCFNPRAHAGRDLKNLIKTTGKMFQSTRPRGARRGELNQQHAHHVSIHAPTRGATDPFSSLDSVTEFQSTRPRGARLMSYVKSRRSSSFNPRAHAGRDVISMTKQSIDEVSIHAPTRGATACCCTKNAIARFNPRAHAGRDPCVSSPLIHALFQSTRPRGARPAMNHHGAMLDVSIHAPTRGATVNAGFYIAPACFNPRAHAGRDLPFTHCCTACGVSIHAPTRGATNNFYAPVVTAGFNPRAHAGRDHRILEMHNTVLFQSTRPRGARRASRAVHPLLAVSIHAPTRGATPNKRYCRRQSTFQSTRPRGARPANLEPTSSR